MEIFLYHLTPLKIQDYMWAVVFATSNATVVLQCGDASSTSSVKSGVNKLKVSLAGAGGMSVKMVRNGQTIISETAENYTYNLHPTLCAFFFLYQMVSYSNA